MHRQNKSHIGTVDAPDARFHSVYIGLVCPLSPLRVHRFLLAYLNGREETVIYPRLNPEEDGVRRPDKKRGRMCA